MYVCVGLTHVLSHGQPQMLRKNRHQWRGHNSDATDTFLLQVHNLEGDSKVCGQVQKPGHLHQVSSSIIRHSCSTQGKEDLQC